MKKLQGSRTSSEFLDDEPSMLAPRPAALSACMAAAHETRAGPLLQSGKLGSGMQWGPKERPHVVGQDKRGRQMDRKAGTTPVTDVVGGAPN